MLLERPSALLFSSEQKEESLKLGELKKSYDEKVECVKGRKPRGWSLTAQATGRSLRCYERCRMSTLVG